LADNCATVMTAIGYAGPRVRGSAGEGCSA